MSDARRGLLERIEADRDRLVGFLQAFTRIDTANPPGDTRAGAAFIGDFLERAGRPYRRIAPQEAMPNLLAATRFTRPGRHLVLNGHIDVFPAGDRAVRRAQRRSPSGIRRTDRDVIEMFCYFSATRVGCLHCAVRPRVGCLRCALCTNNNFRT